MSARLPSIDGLLAFEAAARLTSFEKSAVELAVTSSAISKRITTLEELLGAQLFSRKGKKVVLTVAGKEYLDQVRGVLAQLGGIVQHKREVQAAERLRIVSTPTFARQVLVPHLGKFAGDWPGLDIELVVTIPFLDSATPEADVEVRFGSGSGADQRLLFEPVFAMAAPAYLERIGPLAKPADLKRATLLRCPLEPWTPWLAAAGLDWGEPSGRRAGPKLVDLGLSAEAAAGGLGVTLGRASLAAEWLDTRRLVKVFSQVSVEPAQGYWIKQVKASPQAAAFVKWLHGVCAALEKSSRKR